MGNHEYGLMRFENITQEIARMLGVAYGGLSCKVALCDDNGQSWTKLFLCHASKNKLTSASKDPVQRKANMLASLKQSLQNKASDCQLMACGHTHKLLVLPPTPLLVMGDDGTELTSGYTPAGAHADGYILPEARWYANTGSFLRTNVVGEETYAELLGYDPVDLGWIKVTIEDYRIANVEAVQI